MVTWGISSIKMLIQAPQNIIDLASSSKGALKNGRFAKFDCKIFSASISAPDIIVNTLATFPWAANQSENVFFVFAFVIMEKASIVFNPIGTVINTIL